MTLITAKYLNHLLADSKSAVVGISGGVDSMVLLHVIATQKSQIKCDIKVIYVDHGINKDSESWGQLVSNYARQFNIPCIITKVSLAGLHNNLEYAARQARYKAFCETGCESLILAHHANDQCESFLLKLFRGSGIKGLKSMSEATACWYDKEITVVRPLLSITRQQIQDYADEYKVPYIMDPSNLDNKYDRNYVRNKIWPVISERFEIADINTIRSIQHLAESWELTATLADIDYNSIVNSDQSLDWLAMKSLGYVRLKNVILRILDKHGVYSFTIGHVEQFAKGILNADMNSRNEMAIRGFLMKKNGKKITFEIVQNSAA